MECVVHLNMGTSHTWNIAKCIDNVSSEFFICLEDGLCFEGVTQNAFCNISLFDLALYSGILHSPWLHNHYEWGIIVKGRQICQKHQIW